MAIVFPDKIFKLVKGIRLHFSNLLPTFAWRPHLRLFNKTVPHTVVDLLSKCQ